MEATLFDLPKAISQEEAWDNANPEVWIAFEKLALDLAANGVTHFGAKAVMETLRFRTAVRAEGPFKIDNSMTAYYARKFLRVHPEYPDLFEVRRSKLD